MLLMSYGADLNARNEDDKLPIDVANNEAMKQAIREEPRRRMDEAPGKRATEQDQHPNTAASANTKQNDDKGEEGEQQQQNNIVAEEEAKILAEINEDSEPSDEEDDERRHK